MIYHYTQLRNLPKIFLSDKVVFRLYDSRWMNDPSEAKILKEYILNYQENITEQISPENQKLFKAAIQVSENFTNKKTLPHFTYVLSFSEVEDSNIFWGSNYSGLSGIAIQLDESYFISENFEKIGYSKLENVYYFNSTEGNSNTKDITQVAQSIENLITDIKKNAKIKKKEIPYIIWGTIINLTSIFHKHPSWLHEKEQRFVLISKSASNLLGFINDKVGWGSLPSGISEKGLNIYIKEVKFDFENNKNPRPYIEIELPKKIIKKIILGPNLDDNDFEAIRNFFYYNNYSEIQLIKSKAQIR